LVDQLGVGQVQRRGSGVVQPGVAAAYPDQLLVQPVDAPAVRGEVRWSSSWLASTFHAMDESAVPARYKIRVRGILSETLLGAFPGLHAQARGSQTVLVGPLPDQAALHGVLAWIEALGLELLEVRRLGS
jgi:hypothetical protein